MRNASRYRSRGDEGAECTAAQVTAVRQEVARTAITGRPLLSIVAAVQFIIGLVRKTRLGRWVQTSAPGRVNEKNSGSGRCFL